MHVISFTEGITLVSHLMLCIWPLDGFTPSHHVEAFSFLSIAQQGISMSVSSWSRSSYGWIIRSSSPHLYLILLPVPIPAPPYQRPHSSTLLPFIHTGMCDMGIGRHSVIFLLWRRPDKEAVVNNKASCHLHSGVLHHNSPMTRHAPNLLLWSLTSSLSSHAHGYVWQETGSLNTLVRDASGVF